MKNITNILNDLKLATSTKIEATYSGQIVTPIAPIGVIGDTIGSSDSDDIQFPSTVLSSVENGHCHEVRIEEDGTGVTISTHDENLNPINNDHTHIVEDFVYFTPTIDADGKKHSHRLGSYEGKEEESNLDEAKINKGKGRQRSIRIKFQNVGGYLDLSMPSQPGMGGDFKKNNTVGVYATLYSATGPTYEIVVPSELVIAYQKIFRIGKFAETSKAVSKREVKRFQANWSKWSKEVWKTTSSILEQAGKDFDKSVASAFRKAGFRKMRNG